MWIEATIEGLNIWIQKPRLSHWFAAASMTMVLRQSCSRAPPLVATARSSDAHLVHKLLRGNYWHTNTASPRPPPFRFVAHPASRLGTTSGFRKTPTWRSHQKALKCLLLHDIWLDPKRRILQRQLSCRKQRAGMPRLDVRHHPIPRILLVLFCEIRRTLVTEWSRPRKSMPARRRQVHTRTVVNLNASMHQMKCKAGSIMKCELLRRSCQQHKYIPAIPPWKSPKNGSNQIPCPACNKAG